MANKKQDVMMNVMASLNTFGVEYASNVRGFDPEGVAPGDQGQIRFKAELTRYGFDSDKELKQVLADFLSYGKREAGEWGKPHGYRWEQEDDNHVIIYLERLYQRSYEEEEDVARSLGYDSAIQMSYEYGDVESPRVYMAVKVHVELTERFVQRVAPYCWG